MNHPEDHLTPLEKEQAYIGAIIGSSLFNQGNISAKRVAIGQLKIALKIIIINLFTVNHKEPAT